VSASRGLPLDPRAQAIIDAAFATVSDGIAVFDTSSRMVDFNDAFWRFYRFASRASCLHSVADFDERFEVQTPDGDPVSSDRWGAALALTGVEQSGASYRLRRRGTDDIWWGRFNSVPIRDDAGAVTGALVTVRDTSEEERLLDKLRASQSQLRDLMSERERLQDEERKRISRELHDGLQQVLTALNMKLGMAEDAIASDPDAARRWLDEAQDSVIDTSRSIRDMIKALRPRGLAGRGLRDAIGALAQSQASLGLMTCEFSAQGLTGEEPHPDAGDCLYRVAQEALTNVLKHADATRVEVVLSDATSNRVRMRVMDNGRGIDSAPGAARDGLGLVGMRERVAAIGGTLRVTSETGTGTTVETIVPRQPIDGGAIQ
jgi:signal transduction histidine kinase